MPLPAARARIALARCLVGVAEPAAKDECRAAVAVLEELGARRDLDAAADLRRHLGVGARVGPRVTSKLTKREDEVLALIGLGLSNPQIGQRLFISPKTVEHHVGHIFEKLGLATRAAAAAYAAKRGPRKPALEIGDPPMFRGVFSRKLSAKGESSCPPTLRSCTSRQATASLSASAGSASRSRRASPSDSGYAIAEVSAPPGAVNAPHRHPCEETMYVLEGEFEMSGEDGEKRRMGPGAVVHVPPNAVHGFVSVGETTGRLLLVAPAAQESLFDDLSEAMTSLVPGPAVAAVFARHHVVTGLGSGAGVK